MKIVIYLRSERSIVIEGATQCDFNDIQDALTIYHTRWLKRMKYHTVTCGSSDKRCVVCVKDIEAVSIVKET